MADEADQRTQLRSLSDLFAYQVSFKSAHNYRLYLVTKKSINIYMNIYAFLYNTYFVLIQFDFIHFDFNLFLWYHLYIFMHPLIS